MMKGARKGRGGSTRTARAIGVNRRYLELPLHLGVTEAGEGEDARH